jgi:hypothetical protein
MPLNFDLARHKGRTLTTLATTTDNPPHSTIPLLPSLEAPVLRRLFVGRQIVRALLFASVACSWAPATADAQIAIADQLPLNFSTVRLLATNAALNRIYVAGRDQSGHWLVTVIDGTASVVVATIAIDVEPVTMIVDESLTRVIIGGSSTSGGTPFLCIIEGVSHSVSTVALPIAPTAVAVDTATGNIVAAGRNPSDANDSLVVVDAGGASHVQPLPPQWRSTDMVINGEEGRAYIARDDRGVAIFDFAAGDVVGHAATDTRVRHMRFDTEHSAIHFEGDALVAAPDGSDTALPIVGSISVDTWSLIRAQLTPTNAIGFDVNSSRGRLYVAGTNATNGAAELSVFGPSSIELIALPAAPGSIAVNPVTNRIYIGTIALDGSFVGLVIVEDIVDNTPPAFVTFPDDQFIKTQNSAVPVTWNVSAHDDNGPATITCSPASGSAFSNGSTTVACTASDRAGNSTTRSFTVSVAIVPTVTPIVTGPLGQDGWYVGTVTVEWNVFVAPGGLPLRTNTCSKRTVLHDSAAYTVACVASNPAGATVGTVIIRKDTTAPAILPVAPTARTYAPGEVVPINYECADAVSGIASCTASQSGMLNTAQMGSYPFIVTAVDRAGNQTVRTITYTVNSGTSVTIGAMSIPYGTSTTLSAVLRGASGAPLAGKTVTFFAGATPMPVGSAAYLGTALTNAAGVAVITLPASSRSPAVYALRAEFAGDGVESAASYDSTLTIIKATPVITWPAPFSIVYGNPFSAVLNATSSAAGAFTYSMNASLVPAGTYTITATFVPMSSTNYYGASATKVVTVSKRPLTVAANNKTKVFGQALPGLTASLTGLASGENYSSFSGSLSYSTPATASSPPGNYPITVGGWSSPNYNITFVAGTLTVSRASTTVAIAINPATVVSGQEVSFTASVAAAPPGAGAPTGKVHFYDNGVLLGSVRIDNGVAVFSTSGLAPGSHTLQASYEGDALFFMAVATRPYTVTP